MKRTVIVFLLLSLSGCESPSSQMSPDKTWLISSKDRYLDNVYKLNICRYKLTDGYTYEYFEDSCSAYALGDTIKHARSLIKPDTTKPRVTSDDTGGVGRYQDK